MQRRDGFGFTIVELLVVIVVIGILAAITIVSYTGISQRARDATLKSDLTNASTQVQLDYVTNGVYPLTFPSAVKYSPGVGMSLSSTGNVNSYCINGQMTSGSQIKYMYFDSTSAFSRETASKMPTLVLSDGERTIP